VAASAIRGHLVSPVIGELSSIEQLLQSIVLASRTSYCLPRAGSSLSRQLLQYLPALAQNTLVKPQFVEGHLRIDARKALQSSDWSVTNAHRSARNLQV
jgi:hypothetical protein